MKRAYFIGFSILLVVLALGLLWAFYMAFQNLNAPVTITSNTIIPTDITKNVAVPSGQSITKTLLQAETTLSGKPGAVASINLIANNLPITSQTFLNNIAPDAPVGLVQSLAPDYMVGFYRDNTNAWQPFIILKTTSYNDALAGMLAWEPTMINDLSGLMDLSSSSLASLTENTGQNQQGMMFQNTTIDNEAARELDDAAGNPLVVYSLPDNQTIVITESESALRELFARLSPQNFGTIK